MKVLILMQYILNDPASPGSSSDVRVRPLASELERRGVQCCFVNPTPTLNPFRRHLFPYSVSDFVRVINHHANTFDLFLINRVSSATIYLITKKVKGKVVFDIDDPIFLPSGKMSRLKTRSPAFSHLEKIARESQATTASSHSILLYMRKFNDNSHLIHTPVDVSVFNPLLRKEADKFTIGWVGNAPGHLANLKILCRPLVELGKRYDIRFKMVSYMGDPRVKKAFGEVEKFVDVDYGLESWIRFERLNRIISDFDVLVAPLVKNPWFDGKSIVKVSMGMAMGLPVVGSSVGEQKYVIRHSINGFFSNREEEWFENLKTLIEDHKLRVSMGKLGRKTAEEELSSRACGGKLLNLMNDLVG